ncbi:MAG: restriction endonuclease subunit S [Actinomycetota bacterium]|nr:restriction endonuclease subunit S [Actinomycetota bacterium]
MVPYLRAANVKDGVLDLSDVKEMNFTPREQHVFSLRPGDVLMTEGSGSLRSVGASAVWQGEIAGPVCFQNTLLRLRPRPMTDGRFLAWWCRHAFADGLLASISTGANIFHVSAERVRSLPLMYVELADQRFIREFLDAETGHLDSLISKRRHQLRLLEERFESATFSAVTRGVRSARSLSLRWSGLDWVKQIPENWGTPAVSVSFELQLGKMLNAESAGGAGQHPYLRNVSVQWDRVALDDLATMQFDSFDRLRCSLRSGDVLVCEGGEVGRSAVWAGQRDDCYFQKAIHRVRPRGAANGRFLMYCLRAAAKQEVFIVQGNMSTIPHLTGEQLRVQRFPWPPGDEQIEIVRHLDKLASQRDQALAALTRQITLLKERQQALITAAVTGQLDIPGAAA